mgnify:CR=1 FL=1
MANKFTHKFVNAGVKGKLTPALFAARKSITATNRIGSTVASIGNVVWDMRQIAVKSAANKVLAEQARRRAEQRERDAEAEEAAELDKSLQKDGKAAKPTSKQKSLAEKHFGWLNGFLRPIIEFFGWLIKITVIKSILDWLQDPKNKNRLKDFLKKFTFVVKKLYSFVSWIVKDNIIDGLADLFGAGGKDGKDSFWDRVRGLGKLMFGLTMMRWLLNPFAAVTDIVGLLDFIMNWRLPPLRIKGLKRLWGRRIKKGFNALRESKRLKKMVQTIKKFGRPIMKPIKFIGKQFQNFRKGFKGITKSVDIAKTTNTLFPHIASGSKKGSKAFEAGKQVRQTLKNFFGPGSKFGNLLNKLPFKNFQVPKPMKPNLFGKALSNRWKKATDGIKSGVNTIGKWGSNGWDYLSKLPKKQFDKVSKRFLEPVWKRVKPIEKHARRVMDPFNNAVKNSPVGKLVRGAGAKKVGASRLKDIPLLGSLVNFYFAVDSFKNGDTVGGVLESIAGAAELAGYLVPGAQALIPAGVLIDLYLLSRIIPGGVGESIMEWERTKAIPGMANLFEGALAGTKGTVQAAKTQISKAFDGINKWIGADKEAQKTKHITEGQGDGEGMTKEEADAAYEKDKTGGRGWGWLNKLFRNKSQTDKQVRKDVKKYGYTVPSGSFSAGSSHTDKTSRHSTGHSSNQPAFKPKKPWWKVWERGGYPVKGAGGSFFLGGLAKGIGKAFGGIGKAIGGIVSGISGAIGGIINTVKDVLGGPLGQILMMALPVMFPAVAWLGPVLKGINAVMALASGDPLGAIMSLSGAFSSINTVNAIAMPKWMQSMRFSKFGNFMANLNGPGGFLSSKMGKIGVGILSGNYGAAFNAAIDGTSLGASLANLGNKVDEMGLGGVLGAIPGLGPTLQNMGLGDVVGISSLLTGDFSAAGFITGMAEKHGYGGLVKAALGMVGGNFEQGMIDLASEMGVNPEMFGVIDTLQMLREGGESEKQKIMQEIGSISVVSFPVVIQKLLSIPTPVGVESGGGGGSSGSGGLLSRLGFGK